MESKTTTVPDHDSTEQLRCDDFMDGLDQLIQALMPEDMSDTSEEDARTQEDFKQADRLHESSCGIKGGS